MAKKYSKKSLEILAKAQNPLGIKIDTRNLAEEKSFTIVSACNNEKIFAIKEAVNNILNRECKFIETICDSRHSNIAFWGSGYEYEKICESGILVQILY